MSESKRYKDYFDIKEEFFPAIDDAAIRKDPELWKNTYPHPTFIDMLTAMQKVLARQTNTGLWIEGTYGTGKSQCAYTLEKLLSCSAAELEVYWNTFEPLRLKPDLKQKFLARKGQKILTVYKYASADIHSTKDLILAVQNAVTAALKKGGYKELGGGTLRDAAIRWLSQPAQNAFVTSLLGQSKYRSIFGYPTADAIIARLKSSSDATELMRNLINMANEEGITALTMTMDDLIGWLKDIIKKNDLHAVVFIWDEFSEFFKQNMNALTEFQKLAALVQEEPFYLVIITHESSGMFNPQDAEWKKIKDRFTFADIKLPDSIAFDLVGSAMPPKPQYAQEWETILSGMESRWSDAAAAVCKSIQGVTQAKLRKLFPMHPMAALLLKYIAALFQSNQRSMFKFILEPADADTQTFKYFIENHGPYDENFLLTIDRLWHFFYENGRRRDLSPGIANILDTFSRQKNLGKPKEAVLKTVLLMQAIDQATNGALDIFKTSEQNIRFAFAGTDLENGAVNVALQLVNDQILYKKPISGGKTVFAAQITAGDMGKFEEEKKRIRGAVTTERLVQEGGLSDVLHLGEDLRQRYTIHPANSGNFTRQLNRLRDEEHRWGYNALLCFALDDKEQAVLRREIRAVAAKAEYARIVFIDATARPLGGAALEEYIEQSANAACHQGNDKALAKQFTDNAAKVLNLTWKGQVESAPFYVYSASNPGGEQAVNSTACREVLKQLIQRRFPLLFDFRQGLSDNVQKATNLRVSGLCGIEGKGKGVVVGIENRLLSDVQGKERYWETDPTLQLSKIKRRIEELFQAAFGPKGSGRISARDVIECLVSEFGFAPSNLSAFLAGFLLKEYAGEPYRYADARSGGDALSREKLAEMLDGYWKQLININGKYTDTYIQKITPDESAFLTMTQQVFGLRPHEASSADTVLTALPNKVRAFGYPLWCLEEKGYTPTFAIVARLLDFIRAQGKDAAAIAAEIGKEMRTEPELIPSLKALLTAENVRSSMQSFLEHFEDGELLSSAAAIGAADTVLQDVRKIFADVRHSPQWSRDVDENELRALLQKYTFVRESNTLFGSIAHSYGEALSAWRTEIGSWRFYADALPSIAPETEALVPLLKSVARNEELTTERISTFARQLKEGGGIYAKLLQGKTNLFRACY